MKDDNIKFYMLNGTSKPVYMLCKLLMPNLIIFSNGLFICVFCEENGTVQCTIA